jgi:uncharacterized protein (TIGR02145 family)
MNKRILTMILLLPLLAGGTVLMAQQGFGTNSPNPTSVVDMQAASKGLLIPRVELKATNVAAPISSPAHSLLVFNTVAAGVAPNNVTPGFYYWDDTAKVWVRLVNAGDLNGKWNLTGNTETAPVLGTTDGKDMVLKTNSVDRLHISADGSVGVNTTTPSSSALLDVNSVSQGFLPPRMTTAQMDAIGSKVQGLVVYNTSRNCLAYYDGTAFKCFSDRAAKVTKGSDFTTFYNGCTGSTPNYDDGSPSYYGYGEEGYVVTHSTGEVFSNNTQCQNEIISAGGCEGATTVTGVSGRVYKLVEINKQCWMAENLAEKPSRYPVPYVESGWYGFYDEKDSNDKYGYLYHWSAAMNGATAPRSRGACPAGFHIPSDCEFQYFEHGIGMTIVDGQNKYSENTDRDGSSSLPRIHRKMTVATSTYPNCTNASGFSAIYSGYRDPGSDFAGKDDLEHWWTSTVNSAEAYLRKLNTGHVGMARYSIGKNYAIPVRCLKD